MKCCRQRAACAGSRRGRGRPMIPLDRHRDWSRGWHCSALASTPIQPPEPNCGAAQATQIGRPPPAHPAPSAGKYAAAFGEHGVECFEALRDLLEIEGEAEQLCEVLGLRKFENSRLRRHAAQAVEVLNRTNNTQVRTPHGMLRAVANASLHLRPGELLGSEVTCVRACLRVASARVSARSVDACRC